MGNCAAFEPLKFVVILSDMSALQILPHYSFEDWKHWEGKWELIYGIPYAMTGSCAQTPNYCECFGY